MRASEWLERGAFFALLLLIGMRPLLSETYESSEGMFAEYVREVNVTTPATTAGFDLAIWLAALATTVAVAWRRRSAETPGSAFRTWRWTGLELGFVLMVGAAVVSTIAAASNQRLALNASVDWLSGVALAMVLSNLCRHRLHVVLVLAVIVAAGAASAAKSVMQVTTEYRETREDYEQNKAKLWGEVPPDDPRVLLYERRMAANEAAGFLAHSNVQGSFLLLCGFAALAAGGLAGPVWIRWGLGAGGGVLLAAILLTGSKGALAATGIFLLLFAVVHFFPSALRRHWRSALAVGWAFVVLGAAGLAVFGLTRGELPGSSLAFRWNYWQITGEIAREHPWTGVGALNFDRAYMQHKPIDFPEEIRDPHNFVLSILAQWGLPGAAGVMLALVGGSLVAVRRWADAPAETGLEQGGAGGSAQSLKRWILAVIAGYVLLRLWLLRGLLLTSGGQATVFVDVVQYGLIWAAVFATVAAAGMHGVARNGADFRLAVLCGIGAFLLHNTIDFSLFVPGTMTVFAALVGVATAQGRGASGEGRGLVEKDRGTEGRRDLGNGRQAIAGAVAPVAFAASGLVLVLFFVYVPVSRSSAELTFARMLPLAHAEPHYRAAAEVDPLDPVPLSEMAERLAREPTPERLDVMSAALKQAIERDPLQIALYRLRARLYLLIHETSNAESDLREAIASVRQALRLYPHSPDEHLGLAAVLAHAATATGSQEWAKEAREEYARALELDAARPGTDEVRKWGPRKRAEIEAAMAALAQATATRRSEDAPQTRPDLTGETPVP